jgi:hypothetical protein
MGDNSVLLDHARRYFAQAGQSSDPKKMRMLAELGFEYLGLIQQGTRSGAPSEPAAAPPPAPAQNETDN